MHDLVLLTVLDCPDSLADCGKPARTESGIMEIGDGQSLTGADMTAEHFDGSLKTLRQRTPFRPFTVELISGDRFEVDYPDALVVREGVAVFIAPGGIPRLFDHESVSQLIADYNSETRAE